MKRVGIGRGDVLREEVLMECLRVVQLLWICLFCLNSAGYASASWLGGNEPEDRPNIIRPLVGRLLFIGYEEDGDNEIVNYVDPDSPSPPISGRKSPDIFAAPEPVSVADLVVDPTVDSAVATIANSIAAPPFDLAVDLIVDWCELYKHGRSAYYDTNVAQDELPERDAAAVPNFDIPSNPQTLTSNQTPVFEALLDRVINENEKIDGTNKYRTVLQSDAFVNCPPQQSTSAAASRPPTPVFRSGVSMDAYGNETAPSSSLDEETNTPNK
ncbi:MAG: hypothetical protein LBG13_03115 [Holosporales bacterium]|jgi:hypothetical protein|nr:hypothetical protein [Holosporales bacterium]